MAFTEFRVSGLVRRAGVSGFSNLGVFGVRGLRVQGFRVWGIRVFGFQGCRVYARCHRMFHASKTQKMPNPKATWRGSGLSK